VIFRTYSSILSSISSITYFLNSLKAISRSPSAIRYVFLPSTNLSSFNRWIWYLIADSLQENFFARSATLSPFFSPRKAKKIFSIRGFFAIEALFVLFLIPYLFYLLEPKKIILPRETAEICNDIAQIYSYNLSVPYIPGYTFWIDGRQYYLCNYEFRYCTKRFVGKEVTVCAAACSP